MTTATVTKFPEKSPYQPDTAEGILRAYESFVADIDDQPKWLLDLRKSSLKEFKRRGIPTPRLEGWKFTNLWPLVKNYGDKVGQVKVSHDKVDDVTITPLLQALDADWVRAALSEDMPPSSTTPKTPSGISAIFICATASSLMFPPTRKSPSRWNC